MDTIWKGLFGGVASLVKPQSPQKENDAVRRVERFKQLYNSVLQACSRASTLRTPGPLVAQLYKDLEQISKLLSQELRAPPPHTCFRFAAEYQAYNAIGRAASACKSQGVILHAALIFGSFLECGSEAFAESRTFARTLMRSAMLTLNTKTMFVGSDIEAQLLEVLFEVVTKIRYDTETYLPVWFSAITRAHGQEHDSPNKAFIGSRQDDNFPLCYIFMDRIHHRGRIGDFARTGLLYVFECASRSEELDQWLVISDVPTLMASALGALYSDLSRQLSIRPEDHELPLLLAMSDYGFSSADNPIEVVQSVHSPEHAANIATFRSALLFWQDVLQHCKSADVRRTLLDHFQILFVQQVLYPAIVQSSDADGGGYSVAVLTYIADMIQDLEEPELVDMILDYLFAVKRGSHSAMSSVSASPSVERRRSFLLQSAQSGNMEDSLDPSTFNLADLIMNALSSRNPQTLFAALNLHSIIIARQPKYVSDTLVKTFEMTGDDVPNAPVSAIDHCTKDLLRHALCLGDSTTALDKAYTAICQDVKSILQSSIGSHGPDIASRDRKLLNVEDVSLTILLTSLETFLFNDVDVNLALTQTFVALLTCREVRLHGLLVSTTRFTMPLDDPHDESLSKLFPDMDEEEAAAVRFLAAQSRDTSYNHTSPRLMQIIAALTRDIQSLHRIYPRLDRTLAKRSAILLAAEQRPTSSAGLSDFTDDETTTIRARNSSSRVGSRNARSNLRDRSLTPRRPSSSAHRAATPLSDTATTPRGRKISPQQHPLSLSRQSTNSSGSPTPTARRTTGATRKASFMSPSRLTSALFGGPLTSSLSTDDGSKDARIGAAAAAAATADTATTTDPNDATASTTLHSARSPVRRPPSSSSAVFLQPPPVFEIVDDTTEGEMLKRVIRFPISGSGSQRDGSDRASPGEPDASLGSEANERVGNEGNGGPGHAKTDTPAVAQEQARQATLSHVLTNIVLLRNFILELAAIVQMRAIIYDEARFAP